MPTVMAQFNMLICTVCAALDVMCILLIISPRHTKYIGVYSFCLFQNSVCVSVCVSVCKLFFSVKDFSGSTLPRILKFHTKIEYDVMCKSESASSCLSFPLFVHLFFLSNKIFHHRFLSSYVSQSSNFVYSYRSLKYRFSRTRVNIYSLYLLKEY